MGVGPTMLVSMAMMYAHITLIIGSRRGIGYVFAHL